MKKTLSLILGSAILGAGATATLTTDTAQVTELQTEKSAVLKSNVWKDVRLGEIPEWDVSVVSSEEISDAYLQLATELNAKTDPNLYTALREKAVALGVSCITK